MPYITEPVVLVVKAELPSKLLHADVVAGCVVHHKAPQFVLDLILLNNAGHHPCDVNSRVAILLLREGKKKGLRLVASVQVVHHNPIKAKEIPGRPEVKGNIDTPWYCTELFNHALLK